MPFPETGHKGQRRHKMTEGKKAQDGGDSLGMFVGRREGASIIASFSRAWD